MPFPLSPGSPLLASDLNALDRKAGTGVRHAGSGMAGYYGSGGTVVGAASRGRDDRGIFELIEDMSPGGSASAWRHKWNPEAGAWERDESQGQYTLWDDIAAFTVEEGSLVKAELMASNGEWSIYQAPCTAAVPGSGGAAECDFGDTVTVTVSGVANGTCGTCTNANKTWTLTKSHSRWLATDGSICGGMDAVLNKQGDTWYLQFGVGGTRYAVYTSTESCVDSALTLSLSGPQTADCTGWPASLTVNG